MKHTRFIIYISALVALTSCNSDNFYNTKRFIETDKNMYCIGDSIFVTLNIMPLQVDSKEIRVFSDLKNIKLFPYSKSAMISSDFYEFDKTGEINTIIITKEDYFSRTLKGIIQTHEDKIIINFDNYSNNIVLNKSVYEESPDLAIGGICLPIKPEPGAELEETFNQKRIAIVNCEKQGRPTSMPE
ncbi:MAG: hypothetical protein KQH79_09715 [Bacteroidetes bacterium]|nr:hypothetical protein [Bacteroidota bacterium]